MRKKLLAMLLLCSILLLPASKAMAEPQTEGAETEETEKETEKETESTEGEENPETEDAAPAPKETVEIHTAEDLLTVASECRLDSWSSSRLIKLTEDITLPSGMECFIPSFSGTFDGQGHLIDGLSLSGYRANTGLFGTLTESGTIRDLKVSGKIEPEGTEQRLGGIVGINDGTIENCQFDGIVTGDSEIGGIAGHNDPSGVISGCMVNGRVTGNHFCGGIAGYNEGNIWNCVSHASVDTSYADAPFSTDQLITRLEQFLMTGKTNALQPVSSRMDLGGIAGFSAGILNSCTNYGEVGYEHTGYNVGGIAGRSAGLISSCVNNGTVQGRKDTGGIAGQLQPFMEADFSSMVMEQIDTELDVLHAQVDEALEDAGRYSADATARLNRISGFAGAAKDSLSAISAAANRRADELLEKGRQVAAEVGTTAASFEAAHNEISRILGELEPALSALTAGFAWTDADIEGIIEELGLTEEEKRTFREGVAKIRQGLSDIAEGRAMLSDSFTKLSQELAAEGGIEGVFRKLVSGHFDTATGQFVFDYPEYKSTWIAIVDGYANGTAKIHSGIASLVSGVDAVQSIMKAHNDFKAEKQSFAFLFYQSLKDLKEKALALQTVTAAIPSLAAELKKPLDSLSGVQAALAANPISPISEETRQAEQNLYGALSSVKSEMDALNNAANSSAQESVGSFKTINDEVNKIMHLVEDAARQARGIEADPEEHVEELTDQEIESSMEGHIRESKNSGKISADLNCGGIVGSMAVEYDLDPEEDISTSGDTSLDYVLRVRCIINRCRNEGTVRSRNSCAGGNCGRMELGIILGSENTGTVEAGSDYCGGIAGYSNSELRNNTCRAELSAVRYVGGIAGFANILKNNTAMVNISDATQYIGAIAGSVNGLDPEKIVSNRFYSETLCGIDGVNYEGKADSVSYPELASEGKVLPLVLTFTVDGEILDTLTVPYGQSLPAEEIPKVPERDGFSGSWSRTDFEELTSDEVIEAVYSRRRTLLASTVGENGVSKALLEGNFTGTETFSVIQETPSGEEVERWHLLLPDEAETPCRIRFLAPEKTEVMLLENGAYHPVPAESFGKYRILNADQKDLRIVCLPVKNDLKLILVCAGAAAVVLILILVIVIHKKKTKTSSLP